MKGTRVDDCRREERKKRSKWRGPKTIRPDAADMRLEKGKREDKNDKNSASSRPFARLSCGEADGNQEIGKKSKRRGLNGSERAKKKN